ncbi:YopX family protein [Cohnella sp. GCM10027633]|uniref:YopX family protein n=1 Tax=unclassified Cohnella TaxID=2636738 RepID=UPI003644A57B
MREIKFRAWDTMLEKMLDFKQLEHSGMNLFALCDGSKLVHLMQYTGLKDRNGVEIYEGDIVKREWVEINPGSDDFIGVVKYVEGSFCLEDIEDPYSGDTLSIEIGTNEVIGNIYESKE